MTCSAASLFLETWRFNTACLVVCRNPCSHGVRRPLRRKRYETTNSCGVQDDLAGLLLVACCHGPGLACKPQQIMQAATSTSVECWPIALDLTVPWHWLASPCCRARQSLKGTSVLCWCRWRSQQGFQVQSLTTAEAGVSTAAPYACQQETNKFVFSLGSMGANSMAPQRGCQMMALRLEEALLCPVMGDAWE